MFLVPPPEVRAAALGGGIRVRCAGGEPEARHARQVLDAALAGRDLAHALQPVHQDGWLHLALPPALQAQLAPAHDTLQLRERLGLGGSDPAVLAAETAAALLLGPRPQEFPSPAELASALRIRVNVARAAARTLLAFDTEAVERPWDCWVHDEERGFFIREEVPLVDALRRATQPPDEGPLYAFSCYRATEYVQLLGLAEELQHCNPPLHRALERLWQHRAVVSAEFHEVFLRETGSLDDPVPPRYYVPGDRVWFRNPDEASADAAGFEGSWVIYLGGGHFANFWDRARPFDFDGKCLEVYHWRHGLFHDTAGEAHVDETRVAARVAATRGDPATMTPILARMQRYRDPRGVYAEGGCIDSTREQLRWVCPGTADLALPAE